MVIRTQGVKRMTEKPYVRLSTIEFQEVIKIYSENKHLKQTIEKLKKENEELKDEVYEEIDNVLTELRDVYEDIPLTLQKKMNNLYNRLESLRDDL